MNLHDYHKMPPVGAAMTPFPYSVHPDEPVAGVRRLMVEHGIRHIPVQEGGRVTGIISEHDLNPLERPALQAAKADELCARDLLNHEPYVVDFGTPLAEVVAEMAGRRIGSAIVVRHGKLAGILSVVDVCRVLAEILEDRFPAAGGGDAA